MAEQRTTQPARPRRGRMRWLAPAAVTAAVLIIAACGSSGNGSSSGSTGSAQPTGTAGSTSALKTTRIQGVSVLTNAKGFVLYSFVPDTSTKSNCNGTCAQIWPPVKGPAKAQSGVATAKLGTIKRNSGSTQATYNGHPLYTYTADTAPGQDHGNGINVNGGVWHVVPASGTAAPAPTATSSVGGY